jgi:quercetin dioxygenase-like cupin family protein
MSTTTPRLEAKSASVPDQTRAMGSKGRLDIVQIGPMTGVRAIFQPGFHWAEHVAPLVGTDLCQVRHLGYVVSGRSLVRMADGTERELAAGDFFDVPPGHDTWVIGDEPYVSIDFSLKSDE